MINSPTRSASVALLNHNPLQSPTEGFSLQTPPRVWGPLDLRLKPIKARVVYAVKTRARRRWSRWCPQCCKKILVFDQKYQVLGLSTDTIVLVQYRLIVLLTKSTGLSTKGTTKYCKILWPKYRRNPGCKQRTVAISEEARGGACTKLNRVVLPLRSF